MNAEIDKLLFEAVDYSVALKELMDSSDNLNEIRLALQDLMRALDGRLAAVMELRSDEDEAAQTPKLSPVP